MADLNDLQKLLNKVAKDFPKITKNVIAREGEQFIDKNFKNQSFNTGSSVDKWKERKTKDKRGRDITRYRTNRVGRRGGKNKYGRSLNGRAILVGFKTGGDKLKNSIRVYKGSKYVSFRTYKPYGKRHNEGLKGMPKRQFMGKSRYLDKRISDKLNKVLKRRLNG